jgi:hypothetical protein
MDIWNLPDVSSGMPQDMELRFPRRLPGTGETGFTAVPTVKMLVSIIRFPFGVFPVRKVCCQHIWILWN